MASPISSEAKDHSSEDGPSPSGGGPVNTGRWGRPGYAYTRGTELGLCMPVLGAMLGRKGPLSEAFFPGKGSYGKRKLGRSTWTTLS